MVSQKISVLGAGNAGYTISFHLALQGHQVMLFEHPNFAKAVEPLIKSDGVIEALEEEGGHKAVIHGKAKLVGATTDIKKVVDFADILIVIVPAFGQVPIFEMTLPHLRDGQIFLLMPGNFASIAYARIMHEKGVKKQIAFAECETIPYGCRHVRDNLVFINGMKQNLVLGILPGNKTDEVFPKVAPLLAVNVRKVSSVAEAGFMNMNMVIHPPPSLFNAGWVESRGGDDFSFYRDAISPSVAKYIQRIDEERMAVARACGMKDMGSCVDIFCHWYAMPKTDYYRCFHESPYHGFFTGPASMDNRYVTEDLGYLLLPIARHLAPKFGIKCPAIEALVYMAETFLTRELPPQRDLSVLLREGESLEKMQHRLATADFS